MNTFSNIVVALVLLAAVVTLVPGCASQTVELPQVKKDDPIWQFNAGSWTLNTNDLIQPPGDGAPQPRVPVLRASRAQLGD